MAADPWQVQPHERMKFAEHFRNLNPVGGLLGGEQAKRFMLQSQLPPPLLGQIWALADTNSDGKLDLREFSIACKIINLKLHGMEVPKTLPPSLIASLNPTPVVSPSQPPQGFPPMPRPAIPPMPVQPPSLVSTPSNQSLLADLTTQPIPQPAPQPLIGQAHPTLPSQPIQPLIPPPNQPKPIPDLISTSRPSNQSLLADLASPPSSQPLIGQSQPLIGQSQSLIGHSQPMLPPLGQVPVQPVMPSQSVMALTQPLVGQTPPLVSQSQSLMGQTQPLMGQTQPLIGQTQPLMGQPVQPLLGGAAVSPPALPQPGPSPPKSATASALTSPTLSMVTSTPIAAAHKPDAEVLKPGILSPTQEVPMGMVTSASAEWAIPQPQRLKYTQLFNATDRNKRGSVSGVQARSLMLQSRLPQQTLAQIWALSDLDADGELGCEEFVLAMYLCEIATQGQSVPQKLPREMIPPTFRRDSIASNASASSYEERRKDNLARGQAELERRRTALAEAQAKEKEAEAERERKEREEADRREQARLEAQRREQQEVLRKQREDQEKRDAARKEMERQCQLEWEKKRMRELEARRAEEQAAVTSLKARAASLSAELAVATAAGGALAKDTRDTRTRLAAIKQTIDGMRSERDTSMQEMSQLKARVKELNAKQISLNHEKAKLDAEAKASEGAGEGNLNMMEVTLKQLKEKLDAAKAIVELKRGDVETNKHQLSELSDKVSELSERCTQVWKLYEEKRQEYLERKSTAPAESAWAAQPAESGWGAAESAWDAAAEPAWGAALPDAVAAPSVAAAAAPAVGRWRCVYEFTARSADELSLQPGDVVGAAPPPDTLAEPGWRWGTNRGHSGWYPESYVEEISAAPLADAVAEEPLDKTPLEGIAEVPENVSEVGAADIAPPVGALAAVTMAPETYVAIYSYGSTEPGDLAFEAGERIEVVRRDADWWSGNIGDRSGIFPSNYVAKLEETATASHEPQPTHEPQPAPVTPPVQHQQEAKSSTPVCSEVAAITEAARPASASGASRRDSGRDSVTGGRKKEIAQVLANYTANSSEQLSLTKGQLLVVRKKSDSGWWEGELQSKGRSRQVGWFPASYVKVLQSSGRTSGRSTPVLTSKMDPVASQVVIDKVIALYPYTAQNADELSFEKDDIIAVTDREQDPAWWQGELNGTSGLFPSNYVAKLVN